MKKIMNKKEFAECVCKYVKRSLPHELAKAKVCVNNLDLWSDGPRMALLIIRPSNVITTGFCLDKWYNDYLNGNAMVYQAAAAIINDRRLYHISFDDNGLYISDLHNGTIIYA